METNQPKSAPAGRLLGVDVARALAVAGMVMVHFGPYPAPESLAGALYYLPEGRASVLFVSLAGVGIALLSGRRAGGHQARTSTRGKLLFRALLLLPLGLWLQRLDHGVLVILQYYAVFFVLAALTFGLSGRKLLTGAATALLVGPVVYLLGLEAYPGLYEPFPATLGDPLPEIADDLLLSGAYPLVTWAAPLLFGVWLGRTDLGSSPVQRRLLAYGAAATLGSLLVSSASTSALLGLRGDAASGMVRDLLGAEPHSQTTLWMAGSIGSACAVLGASLMVVNAAGGSSGLFDTHQRPAWLLGALIPTGQMALSVYVGHLLLLGFAGDALDPVSLVPALISSGAFMALAMAACTAWRARFGRGPLERVLTLPWSPVERPERPPANGDEAGKDAPRR